ncbi:unnamed protein product, partial [marine sediment metagenome]
MKKVQTNHHTVVDWDFKAGTGKQLYELKYVSAPSSLLVAQWNGDEPLPCILCRIAETLCIAQGEV